jgi:ribulose-phosphate 3-epimerase
MRKFFLSASIICDDFSNLKNTLRLIKKGKIDYIHFDVMDGMFVPRYGLFPEVLQTIKRLSTLPVNTHLMVQNPEPYVKIFADSGSNIITVPVEGNLHLSRTIRMVKSAGIGVGIAINPATSLSVLDYVLDEIDLILLMAINPGIIGHKLIKTTYKKIEDLRNMIAGKKILIEVDGGVTHESASKMVEKGADMLVCGSSTIFKQKKPIDVMGFKLRQLIVSELQKDI